ncbi:MAG: hypothetical protein IJ601_10025 [Acidaminococcaceae bacterium]|nr:hypothetical protein [Acidaminococcaceae bacterium]
MDKLYDGKSKKDKFIIEHLLPNMIKRIEASPNPKETATRVASMNIFPYRTKEGVYLGRLSEPGVSWYYSDETGKSRVSAGSYRILAEELLKKEQSAKLRQTFDKHIRLFSESAIFRDLIQRMGQESNYTELWWNCAYDLYTKWDWMPNDIKPSAATQNIQNRFFLFTKDNCSDTLKEKLIKHRVFWDILTPTARNLFMNRIPEGQKENALSFLSDLGIPHSFLTRQSTGANWMSNTQVSVSPYILSFARDLAPELAQPVAPGNGAYEKCELCHELFERIWAESKDAFQRAIRDINSAIPIKNVRSSYVSLSRPLFYSARELEEENTENEYDEASEFENWHIDAKQYSMTFLEGQGNIYEFSQVDQTPGDYGLETKPVEFYQWIWRYSRHEKLIDNILSYFSGGVNIRKTVPEKYNDFVLSVLECAEIRNADYAFDIDLKGTGVFQKAAILNRISQSFAHIFCVVYGSHEVLAVKEYVDKILTISNPSAQERFRIKSDRIWSHVYLMTGEMGEYDGTYALCKRYKRSTGYEDVILLPPSADGESYLRALAWYVKDRYGIEVPIEGVETVDWKEEYKKLANSIRSFLTETHERRKPEGYTVSLADVTSFGEEKRIWTSCKEQKNHFFSDERKVSSSDFYTWRNFLKNKYHGRCQLCGGMTITGDQDHYFYTYRMVKKASNHLADLRCNLFCLCPSCWGEMKRGDYMGKDLTELCRKGEKYAAYLERKLLSDENEDGFQSFVSELLDEQRLTEQEEKSLDGFRNPIVCRVVVNGKNRCMAFSWEHFMRIAFILHETIDKPDGR